MQKNGQTSLGNHGHERRYGRFRAFRDQLKITLGQPAYEWGLVGIAVAALLVWAWGLGTFVRRLSDSAIVAITVVH